MSKVPIEENAVLGDEELQASLKSVSPRWGDLCVRAAGEVWGLPIIPQKTKALIAVAIDVVTCNVGATTPLDVHVRMALKQGATLDELEELLLFLSIYAGFNKVASALAILKRVDDSGEARSGEPPR
ncbi:carboxymuconolactone decarboxylase family protein [Sorangium sp. So ce388]|uniref:carboxymuconolactone decarboxylase family protein n=1 Tax=Sorangium sp. So ce388 TaxID=3133309 RepID=UPI003F5B9EF4